MKQEKYFHVACSFAERTFNFFFQLLDFDIQRLIDHGTEGAVFLATSKQARHPDKRKQYALKVMFNIFELTQRHTGKDKKLSVPSVFHVKKFKVFPTLKFIIKFWFKSDFLKTRNYLEGVRSANNRSIKSGEFRKSVLKVVCNHSNETRVCLACAPSRWSSTVGRISHTADAT